MPHDAARRWKVGIAFAAVYLIWGSTYLAIRVGVQRLPPALFAGLRFLVAGALLALYARARGQRVPRAAREWRVIAVTAALMLLVANGLVVWSEQWVASNQAALLAATTALWLAGLGAIGPHGHKPAPRAVLGLALGFAGAAVLLLPRRPLRPDHLWAQLALLAASLSWAVGSIYAKRRRLATPPLMLAAMQSLLAGGGFCAIALANGERAPWAAGAAAWAALAYLIVFGSCVAYAAYVWLLHAVSPAALGTYAYVNPVVAVVLGGYFLGERLSALQLGGMLIILAGVVLASAGGALVPVLRR